MKLYKIIQLASFLGLALAGGTGYAAGTPGTTQDASSDSDTFAPVPSPSISGSDSTDGDKGMQNSMGEESGAKGGILTHGRDSNSNSGSDVIIRGRNINRDQK